MSQLPIRSIVGGWRAVGVAIGAMALLAVGCGDGGSTAVVPPAEPVAAAPEPAAAPPTTPPAAPPTAERQAPQVLAAQAEGPVKATPERPERPAMPPELGTTAPAARDAPPAAAAVARRPGPAFRFEPETLDYGDMVVDVQARGTIRMVNVTDAPVRIERSVPSCGCTALGTPREAIAPGEAAEIEITMQPGSTPGIRMSKNITFVIEGYEPQVYTVGGNVTAFVLVTPNIVNAPADPQSPGELEQGLVRIASNDGVPFVVTAAAPAIFPSLPQEAATEHELRIDWELWEQLRRLPRVTLSTDHPKAPTVAFTVRRSVRDPRAPQAPTPTTAATRPPPPPTGAAALIAAARDGDATRLRMEIASGGDVNWIDPQTSRSALHWAAHEGHLEAIGVLVEANADLAAGDRTGMSPLTLAAMQGKANAVRALLDAGAEINHRDQINGSPLLWASGLGNAETVAILLEAGGEVNIADINGLSPLLWATSIGRNPEEDHRKVLLLLQAGADPNRPDTVSGDTPAIRAARSASPLPLQHLIDFGADLHAKSLRGSTTLMAAANAGGPEQVRMLLEAGLDPNQRDSRGWAALDYAVQSNVPGREAVIEILRPLTGGMPESPTP